MPTTAAKTADTAERDMDNGAVEREQAVVNPPLRVPVTSDLNADLKYWASGDFPVTVLVACSPSIDASCIRSLSESLTLPVPVFRSSTNDLLSAGGPAEQFRISFRFVSHDAILPAVHEFLAQSASRFLIVVSDALLSQAGNSQCQPTALTHEIRDLFSKSTQAYCGLIGLSRGSSARASEVDRVLDLRDLSDSMLLTELTRTADGLRLKAPPGKLRDAVDPVLIRLVQTKAEMRKCLQLRHLVYDRMHYLNDAISQHPSQLELDSFDLFDENSGTGAVHFLAWSEKTGEVVGTARLIVPREFDFSVSTTVLGNPPERILRQQADSIRHLVDECDSDDVLHRAIYKRTFGRMPVLQSADLSQFSDRSLLRGVGLAEISRVIVAPRYRGCGVGRLLVRALIAAAIDLQKPNVVLECIAAHVPMYAKFGFQVVEGARGRDLSLDQEAVAMILQQGGSLAKAHGIARNDLKMIRSGMESVRTLADSGYLCLCAERGCWEDGHYSLKDHQSCPLKKQTAQSRVGVIERKRTVRK